MPQNPGWAWIDKPAAERRGPGVPGLQARHRRRRRFRHDRAHRRAVGHRTGRTLPASVERKLVTGWLKGKLGFRGVVTSDDLWYDHVVARFGAEEVAVRAFEAGHDVILKPKDPVATIAALAAAVRSGRIPESRVDEAARKLLTLKARLGLHKYRFVDEARVGEFVGTAAHQALVQEVADRSLTMLKNDGAVPVAGGAPPPKIVNIAVQKAVDDPAPALLAAKLAAAFPGTRSFTLRPDAGSGLLRDGLEGGRGVRPGGAVALRRPEPDGRRGAASRRRPGLPEKGHRGASRRPSWPCPTAIPSSSARSRRSARSSSATASGAGSGTRRSTSTRSSRRSRAS
ncbi:MAG: hypothetical protein M0C28_03615 [Candidatus Moduliflexus flocculans]|nr:hypothetical protein [Candidatus Moduliflexus flocculans]